MEQSVKTILLNEFGLARLDQEDPTAAFEAAFEEVASKVLRQLYPSCHVLQFKPTVQSGGTGWKPDLALVDSTYAFWFIIEVEIATHSLQRHVLPQVRALRDGDYGAEAVNILSQLIGITKDRAATIVQHIPRYMGVISNQENSEWVNALAAENIQHMSIATFSGTPGGSVYFISGLLEPAERSLGFGLVLASHQAIRARRRGFWRQGTYMITEPSGASKWDCIVDGNNVWLTKQKGVITIPDQTYVQLIARDDGAILLRIP